MSRGEPLITADAWRGMWLRGRGGPNPHMLKPRVEVTRWHRVAKVDPRWDHDRFVAVCGRRGSEVMMPSGGHRIEVALPWDPATLPGDVCEQCLVHARVSDEREVQLPEPEDLVEEDDIDRIARGLFRALDEAPPEVIDRLATRVAKHLLRNRP